jgi:hypothetical protein
VTQARLQRVIDDDIQGCQVAAELLGRDGSAEDDVCPGLVEHGSQSKHIRRKCTFARHVEQWFFLSSRSQPPVGERLFDDDADSRRVRPV